MKERKSFIFYYDWWDIFEPMTQIQKGDLLTGIYDYVRNGTEPKYSELGMQIAFNVIRNTLNRDSEKYERICKQRSEGIKKRWSVNKEEYLSIDKNTSVTDNDNVNDNVNDNGNDNVNVNDNDTDNDISTSSSFSSKTVCAYSDDFLEFWKEYPKKVGKGDAFKKWKKAKLTNTDKNDITNALNWQKKSDRWRDSNGRFIPNPSTYISQRRWEDEPDLNFNSDITDPSRYTDGDTLPDFILRGDY